MLSFCLTLQAKAILIKIWLILRNIFAEACDDKNDKHYLRLNAQAPCDRIALPALRDAFVSEVIATHHCYPLSHQHPCEILPTTLSSYHAVTHSTTHHLSSAQTEYNFIETFKHRCLGWQHKSLVN
jgi:hypothetical protein